MPSHRRVALGKQRVSQIHAVLRVPALPTSAKPVRVPASALSALSLGGRRTASTAEPTVGAVPATDIWHDDDESDHHRSPLRFPSTSSRAGGNLRLQSRFLMEPYMPHPTTVKAPSPPTRQSLSSTHHHHYTPSPAPPPPPPPPVEKCRDCSVIMNRLEELEKSTIELARAREASRDRERNELMRMKEQHRLQEEYITKLHREAEELRKRSSVLTTVAAPHVRSPSRPMSPSPLNPPPPPPPRMMSPLPRAMSPPPPPPPPLVEYYQRQTPEWAAPGAPVRVVERKPSIASYSTEDHCTCSECRSLTSSESEHVRRRRRRHARRDNYKRKPVKSVPRSKRRGLSSTIRYREVSLPPMDTPKRMAPPPRMASPPRMAPPRMAPSPPRKLQMVPRREEVPSPRKVTMENESSASAPRLLPTPPRVVPSPPRLVPTQLAPVPRFRMPSVDEVPIPGPCFPPAAPAIEGEDDSELDARLANLKYQGPPSMGPEDELASYITIARPPPPQRKKNSTCCQ